MRSRSGLQRLGESSSIGSLGERYIARSAAGAFLNGARIAVAPVPMLTEAMVALTDFGVGEKSEAQNEIHLRLLARLQRESLRVVYTARRLSISRGWRPGG
jgi:hypothetical protein